MTRMTGGGALVEMLRRHGVETIFALPGVQNDALFVAFYDAGEALRVIHTRHEQGAAYMAYGYARSSGKVGAYAVVPGPGLLNTTAALATAYATNTPVLCISGQILKGLKKPHQCPAFGKECTPLTPLGATMVSAEGACAAYFSYGRHLASQERQRPEHAV